MRTSFILIAIVICLAFNTDVQKRIVRQNGFDTECYISSKKLNRFDANKTYFWFKSGGIHQSLGNVGGSVLHESYQKYYRSNQLAEKGTFIFGLKTGVWKIWNENGQLLLEEHWNEGLRNGKSITYDNKGKLAAIGNYRNNTKVGRWINYKTKDTTYHKKDSIYTEKPRSIIHELLRKKDSLEKAGIKHEKLLKKRNDSIKKAKIKSKKRYLKRQDSIQKSQKILDRRLEKIQDSINRANKKQNRATEENSDKGFFKKLFKKEQ
ncbi:toxin-antitoxin system YwqK family antitoxin [Seonamhaeicola aphaedonensis]|uniref:MORN repeat protein n=1 Tax=Seonamhaeicola aphaedonensis TaxID=1461338 RepID=A0A3D9H5J1_9FLAO|nr:hypothetical protein [Seonamhaeicola aphaedonensis]RED44699.1 MORN repeat protein [Seonamhaeicola aphaedonensis]